MPPGSLQYLQILHFFYGLNWMFSAIALWFLMFCFRHFSLYEPGQTARHSTHCSSWIQSAAKITFYFHSYHILKKMSIKTVKINLQPLRSEPKFLTLFTQFNVLLHSMNSFQSETLTEISLMLRQSSIFAMTHLCVS